MAAELVAGERAQLVSSSSLLSSHPQGLFTNFQAQWLLGSTTVSGKLCLLTMSPHNVSPVNHLISLAAFHIPSIFPFFLLRPSCLPHFLTSLPSLH